ncbi:5-formyltetrahydrofolate cyclo-ligase [Halomarina halobia]|uniref:5-formyltetrahydrofolate cyclo-ligase n=1 Tax=Halomarina halobia TaxID=3033386 RepID=A0ABD6ABS3_9EURY|nr:5-formyltetrahydrofolate cyclo-ligase [Halomarina sp. PSR21]
MEDASKAAVRDAVWTRFEEGDFARFPFPPRGRIPNFVGAERAAERLFGTPEWKRAAVLKANPDSPQRPVRKRALAAGKTVYMAVPRLRDEECFVELDPARIDDYDHASTIKGSSELGVRVGPDALPEIDLVVAGSVAVSEAGVRIGKGEGYSDLEYAILRELGAVDDGTPLATTVHEAQVGDWDATADAHDVPLDLIATPGRVIRAASTDATKPGGIDWGLLDDERVEEIPVLRRLRR